MSRAGDVLDYASDWREMPIWALLMLNAFSETWKSRFLNFSVSMTDDCLPCFKVRVISDYDSYEIWEVVKYYGIKNLG